MPIYPKVILESFENRAKAVYRTNGVVKLQHLKSLFQ